MQLLVLGATGGTGHHVVSRALEQRHEVTVFARHPERVVDPHRVRVVAGDVRLDGEALAAAMKGQDAVISALGAGKSFRPDGLIAGSMPAILQAMERAGVRRLIFTSAFGVGPTWSDAPFMPRMFIRLLLRDIYADKEAGERMLRQSSLDWTIVYPTGLTDKPRAGRYRAGERLALSGFPTISREDLAGFLVSQIDDRQYVRKGVLLSS